MALAVVLGVIAGVVGFLPLAYALVAVKHVTETSNFSYVSICLLAVLGSMLVLAGAVIACAFINRASIIPFACGEAGALIVAAAVFGVRKVYMNSGKRKKGQQ